MRIVNFVHIHTLSLPVYLSIYLSICDIHSVDLPKMASLKLKRLEGLPLLLRNLEYFHVFLFIRFLLAFALNV